ERFRGPNPPWAFAAPEPAVGPALVRSPSTVGPADAGWLDVVTGRSGRVNSPNICGVIEVGAGSAGCTGSSASVVLGGANGFMTGTVITGACGILELAALMTGCEITGAMIPGAVITVCRMTGEVMMGAAGWSCRTPVVGNVRTGRDESPSLFSDGGVCAA